MNEEGVEAFIVGEENRGIRMASPAEPIEENSMKIIH